MLFPGSLENTDMYFIVASTSDLLTCHELQKNVRNGPGIEERQHVKSSRGNASVGFARMETTFISNLLTLPSQP